MKLHSIWTKPKFKFLLFCWIRVISNFRSAQPNVNSFTFCKNTFFIENYFSKWFFFLWMGGKRVRACASPQGPHPESTYTCTVHAHIQTHTHTHNNKNSSYNLSPTQTTFCHYPVITLTHHPTSSSTNHTPSHVNIIKHATHTPLRAGRTRWHHSESLKA